MSAYSLKLKKLSNENFNFYHSWVYHRPKVSGVMDWNENGIFVLYYYVGRPITKQYNNSEALWTELWKYNIGAQSWKQLKFPDKKLVNILLMEKISHDRLLFIEYTENAPFPLTFYLYDVLTETLTCSNCYEISGKITRNSFCKNGNTLYVQSDSKLFSLDLDNLQVQELSSHRILVWIRKMTVFDNKLFFLRTQILLPSMRPKNGRIYYFDLGSRQWSSLPKAIDDIPWDCYMEDFGIFGDSSYHFVYTYTHSHQGIDGHVYKFHFPTLSWIHVPVMFPSKNFLFAMKTTKEDEIYCLFKDGLYKLNLNTTQPRSLQNICWDKMICHPRIRSLDSYTNDKLHDFGIPRKFRLKLH